MNTGLKLISCEKHTIRVFYPVGCVCPACFPEMYPKWENIKNITEPTTLKHRESQTVYITAGSLCPVCHGKGGIKAGDGYMDYLTCHNCEGQGVVNG